MSCCGGPPIQEPPSAGASTAHFGSDSSPMGRMRRRPCPGQNKGWTKSGITALRVIQSPDVPAEVKVARDASCDSCQFRFVVGGRSHCGCCGCPAWRFGKVGSDLDYKNGKAAWMCPRPEPAFGPWEPSIGMDLASL